MYLKLSESLPLLVVTSLLMSAIVVNAYEKEGPDRHNPDEYEPDYDIDEHTIKETDCEEVVCKFFRCPDGSLAGTPKNACCPSPNCCPGNTYFCAPNYYTRQKQFWNRRNSATSSSVSLTLLGAAVVVLQFLSNNL